MKQLDADMSPAAFFLINMYTCMYGTDFRLMKSYLSFIVKSDLLSYTTCNWKCKDVTQMV